MVTVEGRGMMGVPGIAARTFGAVASQGASVLMISQASSEQSICFIVPQETAQRRDAAPWSTRCATSCGGGDIDRVASMDDVVIVTAVGRGDARHAGRCLAHLRRRWASNGINVIAIAQGASECGVSMVIAASDAPQALRRIHERVILKK